MLISDNNSTLISSADLTRDQLRDEFNAGIVTEDENTVKQAIEYFDRVWNDASRVDHS
jgi:hypothetical protein